MKKILLSTKPTDTKPWIDWFRRCGIDGIQTEDDAMRIWEIWSQKANRMGRRTPQQELNRHFTPGYHFFKQMDIPEDADRSSDLVRQSIVLRGRELIRAVGHMTVSEHAVRRYWEHTSQRPAIEDWFERFPWWHKDWTQLIETVYCPQGLLKGYLYRSPNQVIRRHIDHHTEHSQPGIGFRVATIIPVDLLNEGQTAEWYALKQQAQEAAK